MEWLRKILLDSQDKFIWLPKWQVVKVWQIFIKSMLDPTSKPFNNATAWESKQIFRVTHDSKKYHIELIYDIEYEWVVNVKLFFI